LKAPPLHKISGMVIAWIGLLGIHKFIVFTQVKNRRCMKPNIVAEKNNTTAKKWIIEISIRFDH
jgi:hypothetical protein